MYRAVPVGGEYRNQQVRVVLVELQCSVSIAEDVILSVRIDLLDPVAKFRSHQAPPGQACKHDQRQGL